MNRPDKRQRKNDPPSWVQNHSLACVASPLGDPILTPVASASVAEIFLKRLSKEIIEPFKWSRGKKTGEEQGPKKVWKQRVVLGTNQCTRVLKAAVADSKCTPSLIVLARDIYPPIMLSHIPVMAKLAKVPVLLLPGKASEDLAKAFGIRRLSIIVFLEYRKVEDTTLDETERDQHEIITSFIRFVKETLLS